MEWLDVGQLDDVDFLIFSLWVMLDVYFIFFVTTKNRNRPIQQPQRPQQISRHTPLSQNIHPTATSVFHSTYIYIYQKHHSFIIIMGLNGETFQDRSKGKDVRTSNILAAKVRTKVSCVISAFLLSHITHQYDSLSLAFHHSSYFCLAIGGSRCDSYQFGTTWYGQVGDPGRWSDLDQQ